MFFFQAEDGMRDIGVTGVQTCALPISLVTALWAAVQERSPREPLARRLGRLVALDHTFLRLSALLSPWAVTGDRKSVVSGKSVDLGGRRIIKTKTIDE